MTVRLESVSIFYSFGVMACCHRNDVCPATRLRRWQRLVSKEITGAPALFSQVIIGLRVRGVLSMRPLLGIRYSHPFTELLAHLKTHAFRAHPLFAVTLT